MEIYNMNFYINGNLSPTEAVKMHPELQAHPVIEEWAQAAEDIESLAETVNDCQQEVRCALYPENYLYNIRYLVNSLIARTDHAKQIKKAILKQIEETQNEINRNTEYAKEKLDELAEICANLK